MPKKTYAKKRRITRRFKKKPFSSSKVMINKMPKRVHNVVSPMFFTTLQAQCQVRIPTGGGAVGNFSVWASQLFEPFNTPQPLSALATNLGAIPLDNVLPAGLTALSYVYMSYRVHKCTMRITVTPRASADQLLLILLPQDASGIPVADAQQALSQPYSKTITCTGNNNIKQNTLTFAIKNRDYYGKTKVGYRSENDYACIGGLTGAPTINLLYSIWYQTYSGAVTANELAINVVLTYSVELFEPNTDLSI